MPPKFRLLVLVVTTLFLSPVITVSASDCAATVAFDKAAQAKGSSYWEVTFQVEVTDCRSSSGRFEFDMTVEGSAHSTPQELTKTEVWTEHGRSSFTIEYSIQLGNSERVGEVTVNKDTVTCTCREEASSDATIS